MKQPWLSWVEENLRKIKEFLAFCELTGNGLRPRSLGGVLQKHRWDSGIIHRTASGSL